MHVILLLILPNYFPWLFERIGGSKIVIRVLILILTFAFRVGEDGCELIDHIRQFAAEMEFFRENDGLLEPIGVDTVDLLEVKLVRLLLLVGVVLLPSEDQAVVLGLPLLPVHEAGQLDYDVIIPFEVEVSLRRLIDDRVLIRSSIVLQIPNSWLFRGEPSSCKDGRILEPSSQVEEIFLHLLLVGCDICLQFFSVLSVEGVDHERTVPEGYLLLVVRVLEDSVEDAGVVCAQLSLEQFVRLLHFCLELQPLVTFLLPPALDKARDVVKRVILLVIIASNHEDGA